MLGKLSMPMPKLVSAPMLMSAPMPMSVPKLVSAPMPTLGLMPTLTTTKFQKVMNIQNQQQQQQQQQQAPITNISLWRIEPNQRYTVIVTNFLQAVKIFGIYLFFGMLTVVFNDKIKNNFGDSKTKKTAKDKFYNFSRRINTKTVLCSFLFFTSLWTGISSLSYSANQGLMIASRSLVPLIVFSLIFMMKSQEEKPDEKK